ncbi:EAL domain-containing protein [Pleomorphomonas oryzae]|uniref:EAL domain-containing protein n=1 Tax=Pleomorphomonas oryzae TaxID=261934 RepID=UPI0006853417|nr:EAL domain-containing protein [Pleomorphomonas oryzae]
MSWHDDLTGSVRDTSIRTKLSGALVFILLLVAAVSVLGVAQVTSVNRVTTEIREVRLPQVELLEKLRRLALQHQLVVMRRLQVIDYRNLAEIDASLNETRRELNEASASFKATISSPEEQRLFAIFSNAWEIYLASLNQVNDAIESGELEEATHFANDTTRLQYQAAVSELENLITYAKAQSEDAAARASNAVARAITQSLVFLVVASLAAVGAIVWVQRNVSDPLRNISHAMRRLTVGDHTTPIPEPTPRRDEIGVLVLALAGYRDALIHSREFAYNAEREWERLRAAVANMPVGLSMFDATDRLIICNRIFCDMYGLAPEDTLRGRTCQEIFADASQHGGIYAPIVEELADARSDIGGTAHLVYETGDRRILALGIQSIADGGWIAIHEDITARRRVEEKIRHMARHDALTDLGNRLLFRDSLEEALSEFKDKESVAVLCIDLDRFKNVNDTLGHPVGDALLQAVADRLRSCISQNDIAARFGGDEFAIIQLGPVQQPEAASDLARRIVRIVGEPYEIDGQQIIIGASVGIAVAPVDGKNADILLKNADMALYAAKADGRGVYRFFRDEMSLRSQTRRLLELELRRALVSGELCLHYQPMFNMENRDIIGFEALLRWNHPTRGIVPPNDFIWLAEEVGLIVPIGQWVMEQACRDASNWPDYITIAVNVSPVQFRDRNFADQVVAALAASGLEAHRLEIEITERVLIADTSMTLAILQRLHEIGIRIAMDDFGTGYSSLGYLRQFHFDRIKIDRSFVADLGEGDQESLAIVRAVAGLSSSLNIATTAEGVESEEQFERLRAEGCDTVQGFLLGVPVPLEDVTRMFEEGATSAA